MSVNSSAVLMARTAASSSHSSFFHLVLLVLEAVLEVVCLSIPGYIAARRGMFDAAAQKLVASLNLALFTPCLIFTKLGSQLSVQKSTDLAIIPVIFVVQTSISYLSSRVVSRYFRFKRRQSNFVTAMAVFGNSNSLPISLVMSLSQTLDGLRWDLIPNDSGNEVAARGILYLLIFQQLGQVVRWTWGYHVLLAPKDRYIEEAESELAGYSRMEQGLARYHDDPAPADADIPMISTRSPDDLDHTENELDSGGEFPSDGEPPTHAHSSPYTKLSKPHFDDTTWEDSGRLPHRQASPDNILSFPEASRRPRRPQGSHFTAFQSGKTSTRRIRDRVCYSCGKKMNGVYGRLPRRIQHGISMSAGAAGRCLHRLWEFMNPPLWATLAAMIVASLPPLQWLFFHEESFVRNSFTRAVTQSGQVAVPLILVVLGANLERNTFPEEALDDMENPREERKLIMASLVARMLLPSIIMAPLLALMAKYSAISILDDPIFIVVCFLLSGAPSALQLAQICQINNVYVGAMSKLLFQSYVVWIVPSTLVLVTCALEVVKWATKT